MAGVSRVQAERLTRRSFVVMIGGSAVGVAFGAISDATFARDATAAKGGRRLNAWVTIADNGIVTITSPASEMGQGVMTAMPALIAEDMDADWAMVRVVQAPADSNTYGNPGFGGRQLTGGSRTTQGYYEMLRLVGAQTRKVLIAVAADMLKVPVGELSTEPNRVVHKNSGQMLGYGEIAGRGILPNPLPQAAKSDLKPIAQCRLIGNASMQRLDIPSKTNGSARFGIDVQLPDMLYGAVLRAPVQGEQPKTIDDAAAKLVTGITAIVPLPYGVGIIGETVEATRKAKDLLKVEWSISSKVRTYDSDALLAAYADVGRDSAQTGVTVHAEADALAAILVADKVIAADYLTDHVYHATMEPMNATAQVTASGVEIWASTQGPAPTQMAAAKIAGVTPDRVKVNTMLIGGGFGRRGEVDFITDAVLLAKAVPGRPVKVIWSREDDVQHGKYRPLTAQHIKAGIDAGGNIVGWHHRIVAQSIYARSFPDAFAKSGGVDGPVTEGSDISYDFPAHRVEYLRQPDGHDVGFWRAVGAGYTKFAIECMIDELAAAKSIDPLKFRLALLEKQTGAYKVIEAVGKMAGWSRKRKGRALGLAYSDAWHAHCAQIAEVSLDRESGDIRVHNVWCAIDPGLAIQPLNIKAQMVGGIIHGTSHALFEQINIVKGEVKEDNFGSYRVLRMSEAPDVHVQILTTPGNPPSGIGEVGLPPVAPAIANAIARLTGGVRLRHMPFLPDRVKAALAEAREKTQPTTGLVSS
jgi:isoquinoline 1-oxidoreductase subunit beta